MSRGFKIVKDEFRKYPQLDIKLPERATEKSAGYDICTPVKLIIPPNEKVMVATDIKAFMNDDEVLQIHVRSSIGIKKGLILSNITGIIDSDYFENETNDGNIHLALTNISSHTAIVDANERVAQGIFVKFLVSDETDEKPKAKRKSGLGHTGKE